MRGPWGTVWEFEDAYRSYVERKMPDLVVYRRTSDPLVSLSRQRAEIEEQLRQKEALDAFLDHRFGNPRDTSKAGFITFATPDQFEERLETHHRKLILERQPAHRVEGAPKASWHRGSPFRSLEAFEFEHTPIFLGRTQAIGAVRDALIRQAAEEKALAEMKARNRAEREARIAGASRLAVQSSEARGMPPQLALLLAVEGRTNRTLQEDDLVSPSSSRR
jgi:hypothetical protein